MREFSFDFVGKNKVTIGLSIVLVILSLASIFFKSFNFGLDFTGGMIVDVTGNLKIEEIKIKLNENNYRDIILQNYDKGLMIKISKKDILNRDKDIENIKNLILKIDKNSIFNRVDFIEPQVGGILVKNGIISLVISFVGILLYIWARFKIEYGVSAILTLLQNIIVLAGFISFFSLDFDLTTIAAILTILGYSVNDVVVIFDRIRENTQIYKDKKTFEEIVNLSINTNLTRTIYTSLSTLIAIVPLIFTTISSLKNFSIIIIFGILFGTYSSIFIASQLLLYKKKLKN